ncbi:transmembrane protein 35B-like [Hemiscyllium ocellatum]|uniref:transmembrane protein 35B-like n=1 Tax=Hemiscyllium ocellatum TaxID=170820 RepID=UPI0029663513|nr:transmembrane protein 35B-like [Hemiscyllium ocellatum]
MALVFVVIRVLLGLFFMLTGAIKLTDRISPELHAEAVDEFVKFAQVFPLIDEGIEVDPMNYQKAVGWIELIGGFLLAFGLKFMQEVSNIALSIVMMGAIHSLMVLKKPLYMCIPASVCLGLLLLLLYVWRRDKGKQKEE